MKLTLSLAFFYMSFACFGQAVSSPGKLQTVKYAGRYSFGKDIEKTRVGSIIVYPETDSTILFYIDLNRGAPSYNMGSDWGRVKISDGTGVYFTIEDDEATGCKWNFHFSKNTLEIITVDDQRNCGFGFGVYVDAVYVKMSKKIVDFFEDMEGKKRYFKDIK